MKFVYLYIMSQQQPHILFVILAFSGYGPAVSDACVLRADILNTCSKIVESATSLQICCSATLRNLNG